jgi:hypothetical protein
MSVSLYDVDKSNDNKSNNSDLQQDMSTDAVTHSDDAITDTPHNCALDVVFDT